MAVSMAVSAVSFTLLSLTACGSGSPSEAKALAAYDDGDPETAVLATPTDPYAARFGIAWWEASAQNLSSAGAKRVGIVFYGHASSGFTELAGRIVFDETRIASLPSDATLAQLATTFEGTNVISRHGELSAQDRLGLLRSVVNSMATIPASGLVASSLAPGWLSAQGVSGDTDCSKDALSQMSSSISSAMGGNSSCNGCQGYASILAQEPVVGAASPQCQRCASEVLSELKISPTHWEACESDAGHLTDADLHFDAVGDESPSNIGNLCDGCGGEINIPDEGGTTLGGGDGGGSGDNDAGSNSTCDNGTKSAPAP
jgi:hypothetical protein